jgi:hypothetical protein
MKFHYYRHPNPYYLEEMKKTMTNFTSGAIYLLLEKEMQSKEIEKKMKLSSDSLINYIVYSKNNSIIIYPFKLNVPKFQIIQKKFIEYTQLIHEFFELNKGAKEHGIHLSHDDLNYYVIGRKLINQNEIFVAYHENV